MIGGVLRSAPGRIGARKRRRALVLRGSLMGCVGICHAHLGDELDPRRASGGS
jgi:hypothetical protein